METICPSICSISRPWSAKSPLPVDVRRSQRSLLIKLHIDSMGPSSAVGGKDEKKNRQGSSASTRKIADDPDLRHRTQMQFIVANNRWGEEMSHCYVRQTGLWSRSFGNQTSVIISEKDYVTVKKKTCWPAPVSLLPVHNLSILIISPFFTINVRALMVACVFNCFKK